MKNLFLLLFLFISFTSFSQNFQRIKKIETGTYIQTYHYSSNRGYDIRKFLISNYLRNEELFYSSIVKSISPYENFDTMKSTIDGIDNGLIVNKFNTSGLLVRVEDLGSSSWVNTKNYFYSNGDVVSVLIDSSIYLPTNAFTSGGKTQLIERGNKNFSLRIYFNLLLGGEKKIAVDTFFYNSNGLVDSIVSYSIYSTSQFPSVTFFQYNNLNQVVSKVRKSYSNSGYSIEDSIILSYNLQNKVENIINYAPGPGGLIPSMHYNLTYKQNGIFPDTIYMLYRGDLNKVIFNYDDNNQIVKTLFYSYQDAGYVLRQISDYIYEDYNPFDEEPTTYGLEYLTIFPNPSSDYILINSYLPNASKIEIKIIDILGNTIFEKDIEECNTLNESINLSTLSSGNYLLLLKTNAGMVVKKIVVQ